MALTPQVLTDVRIYYGSADLTGYSNKVEINSSVDDLDTTTFASGGWHERVGGLYDTQANVEGFFQAGDNSMPDDVAWTNLADNSNTITICPTSGALASLCYFTRAIECSYKPGGDVGGLLGYSLEAKGNWPLIRGQIMQPQGTARTATGNGTGAQLGAVSAAQRMYANLHVMSIAGTSTPTLTVKLQSSVDNAWGAPTDRITFTAATVLTDQASSVLGAITDTWWRAVWTISGSSPSFLFAVSAGIAPK